MFGGVAGNVLSNPSQPGLQKAGTVLLGIVVGAVSGIVYTIMNPAYTIIGF